MQPHMKGKAKNFVDGAGIPSPGRWRIKDRRLPGNEVAEELKAALRQGLGSRTYRAGHCGRLCSSWQLEG